jgi:hypothetical protein
LPELPVSKKAQTSKLGINEWMEYLSDKADEQYKQMTPKQREDTDFRLRTNQPTITHKGGYLTR